MDKKKMKEFLLDLLRWGGWVVVVGLLVWLQKTIFKK